MAGGVNMSRKIKLLYKSSEIRKFFNNAMFLDVYDDHTMKFYVNNYLKDLTCDELDTMKQTIEEEGRQADSASGVFGNSFSLFIALLSIFSASALSILVLFGSYLINAGESWVIQSLNKTFSKISIAVFILTLLVGINYITIILNRINRIRLLRLIKIIKAIKVQRIGDKATNY